MRLPSIEEVNLIGNNDLLLGHDGQTYWTGSVSSYVDDYNYSEGQTYYYPLLWVWSRGYNSNTLVLDEYDSYSYSSANYRPVLVIPTSDLSQSNKYVALTTPYISSEAQTIAATVGLDYDDMNIDYEIINAFTEPSGKMLENEETYRYLNADLNVIEIYANTVLTSNYNVEGYGIILNYFKTIADDGKIYSIWNDEELDTSLISDYPFNFEEGYLTISGVKYYYKIAINRNFYYHRVKQQYSSYFRIELSTEYWS